MTNDKGILIRNIYYMLSYAYQVLQQSDYQSIAAEEFEHIDDLFAAILAKGISRQLKQGLYREYVPRSETLPVLRGKLDFPQTIRNRTRYDTKLACTFDELSENNLYNQILKTTLQVLLRDASVLPARKTELKKLRVLLQDIAELSPAEIRWNELRYQRNNKNYEMLLNLCYFVLHDLLQTTEQGDHRMTAFSEQHMARLFERFILEYYRQHHTYLSEVKAAQIKWDICGENDASAVRFLPAMQTDIWLRYHDKILIMDAKYYGKTMQQQFDKATLHSANLYQIYTYVKNQDVTHSGNVAGMLVYAKTQEAITPDCMFDLSGNQIGACTLDLNQNFRQITAQLDRIAEHFFGRQYARCPNADDRLQDRRNMRKFDPNRRANDADGLSCAHGVQR